MSAPTVSDAAAALHRDALVVDSHNDSIVLHIRLGNRSFSDRPAPSDTADKQSVIHAFPHHPVVESEALVWRSELPQMPTSDLPDNLSRPAQRALAGAGITRLEQLSQMTERELLALHGVGPKTIVQLRPVLAGRGLSFRSSRSTETAKRR